MDDYFHERPDDIDNDTFRATTNLDVPEMLHLQRLNSDLTELGEGNTISKPRLSFALLVLTNSFLWGIATQILFILFKKRLSVQLVAI